MAETQNGIFRKKNRDFTMIANQLARDNNISLKAKGLYLLIQSYIDIPNFVLYKGFLRKKCKEGRDAFDGAWNELKRNGYLIQYRLRDKESQKYYYEYELLDAPEVKVENGIEPDTENPYMGEPHTEKPCAEKPSTEKPSTGKPDTENPYGNNKTYQNKTNYNNTYFSNTSINHTNPTANTVDGLMDRIRERIGYHTLPVMYPYMDMEVVDELVLIMSEVLAMPDTSSIRINGCPIPVTDIKRRYESIYLEHIVYAVDCLDKATGVRNPRGYAITILYNATSTLNVNTQLQIAASYNV